MIKTNNRKNMSDLRDWINLLEELGELKRIDAEVDWDKELGAITRMNTNIGGPALLYENIKDYQSTPCRKLFTNGLGSRRRLALALRLPIDSNDRAITTTLKKRFQERVESNRIDSGPVKEKIITGEDIDLTSIPVPLWNYRDGGRYINTCCGIVTMDPDTKIMNIGMYRGMIASKNTISGLISATQHWGIHFEKYKQRGEEMPVAVVYGWDPVLEIAASAPISHPGYSEYEISGALRKLPVDLVKCETSDLWVPASAEIVIEGKISSDPETFEMEGPFAEYIGYYGGMAKPKPVIRVECITHRDDPIFRGCCEGGDPGRLAEPNLWSTHNKCAAIWNFLDSCNIGEILSVWSSPLARATILRVQIKKTYRGEAKQIAHAIWGSNMSLYSAKIVIVVDEDIDAFDSDAVDWAIAYRVNADMGDIQFAPGCIGSALDPSVPLNKRNIEKYGQGTWTRILIDATVDWNLEPQEQYEGKRFPPLASDIYPETEKLVKKRWKEYGL